MTRTRIVRFLARMAAALAGAALSLGPAAFAADVSGEASAFQATVLGTPTALAATGPLAGADDLREASALAATVPLLVQAAVLHSATGASSTSGVADSVDSEASLADLGLTVAGNTISAAFVMARAWARGTGAPAGTAEIDGLSINGVPVAVTGMANQTIHLPGGRVVLNEQTPTPDGTVVRAIHVVIDGVADISVASAVAGLDAPGGSTPPLLPPPPPLGL